LKAKCYLLIVILAESLSVGKHEKRKPNMWSYSQKLTFLCTLSRGESVRKMEKEFIFNSLERDSLKRISRL
jgi:hypothetical protein